MVTGNWSLHNNAWLSNISGYLINAYRAEPGISNFEILTSWRGYTLNCAVLKRWSLKT